MGFLRQNTPITKKIGPLVLSSDGKTPASGIDLSSIINISKNDGSFVSRNSTGIIEYVGIGCYNVPFDETDLNTIGEFLILIYETGIMQYKDKYFVLSQSAYDTFSGITTTTQNETSSLIYGTSVTIMVRGLINDLVEPYNYSDERITELISIGASLVIREVASSQYVVNQETNTITPSPSESMLSLIALKTACLITQGEYKEASKRAVSIKDGPSSIDPKEIAKQLGKLSKAMCDSYDKAKIRYQVGDGSVGKAITGPFSNGQYYSRNKTYFN
jgi:hypothetical protein